MNRTVGFAVLCLGILVLLGGLSMPTYEKRTSTTCVDSAFDAADGCVQTDYRVPNAGRSAFIGIGFLMLVSGGLFTAMADSEAVEATLGEADAQSDTATTLAEEIARRQDEKDRREK